MSFCQFEDLSNEPVIYLRDDLREVAYLSPFLQEQPIRLFVLFDTEESPSIVCWFSMSFTKESGDVLAGA